MLNILTKIGIIATMAVNADSWKETLPVMAIGMIGIFIVIGVIILFTYGLNKVFSSSGKKKDKDE